jgi:hypothetical protein
MHRKMSVQYGNSVITQQIVYKLIESFENGRTSVKHEEGPRCPSTSVTDANMELGHAMILQNRWVMIDEVAHQRQISHCSAYEIIHRRLAFHKVCARWVPEQLTELHKEKCLDICKRLMGGCSAEGDYCLERIVTGDETCIHHYNPDCKHPHSPTKKEFIMHPTAGSLMLTVFWNSPQLLMEHYQERGSTVNSTDYSEMLCDETKPVIRSQRRGLLSEG